MTKEFLTGNKIVVESALSVGAEFFAGYPITPSTEITHYWSEAADNNFDLTFLQTEDETSAGFEVIGAILGGNIAFTATAGPGNILMQDGITAAEALRLPFVGIIMQRGGPSTGTVIFSQQELNLTCFGGNGEGLRIVYSASNLQELADLTQKVFHTAWKYMFPSFVLGDGYLAKTKGEIELKSPQKVNPKNILGTKNKFVNLRNTYSTEEDLYKVLQKQISDFENASKTISESEKYQTDDAEILIVAHGIVGAAAKVAVEHLRKLGVKVGLWRAITLRPLDVNRLKNTAKSVKKIFLTEASNGQFLRLIKDALYEKPIPITPYLRPALGITPKEIEDQVRKIC